MYSVSVSSDTLCPPYFHMLYDFQWRGLLFLLHYTLVLGIKKLLCFAHYTMDHQLGVKHYTVFHEEESPSSLKVFTNCLHEMGNDIRLRMSNLPNLTLPPENYLALNLALSLVMGSAPEVVQQSWWRDVTSPFPPSGNEGYIRYRDVLYQSEERRMGSLPKGHGYCPFQCPVEASCAVTFWHRLGPP